MDALLAEVSRKRKDLETPVVNGQAAKYLRRSDLEKAREEEARRLKAEEEKKTAEERLMREKEKDRLAHLKSRPNSRSPAPDAISTSNDPSSSASSSQSFNLTSQECIRRLRLRSQPILLFGETEKDRRFRLRALEILEERGGGRITDTGSLNDFRRAMEVVEVVSKLKEAEKKHAPAAKAVAAGKEEVRKDGTPGGVAGEGQDLDQTSVDMKEEARTAEKVEEEVLDLSLVKTAPKKVYPLIYFALKNLLKEWHEHMDSRPDEVKRTVAGKNAQATVFQTEGYLKPLFKSLKARDLEPDVLRLLAEIIHNTQIRQYQRANDAYLRLSIGNAAWPIGVTMVGIHERSAREKIGVDSVAHVLNDEVSRKYIQSVKRLMTFAQTIRPPADVSQLMG